MPVDLPGCDGLAQPGCHTRIEGRHECRPVGVGDLQLAGAHQPRDHLAASGRKAGVQIVGTGLGVGPHVGVREIPQLCGHMVGVHVEHLHAIAARAEPDSIRLLDHDQYQPRAKPTFGSRCGRSQKPRQCGGE